MSGFPLLSISITSIHRHAWLLRLLSEVLSVEHWGSSVLPPQGPEVFLSLLHSALPPLTQGWPCGPDVLIGGDSVRVRRKMCPGCEERRESRRERIREFLRHGKCERLKLKRAGQGGDTGVSLEGREPWKKGSFQVEGTDSTKVLR